MSLIRQEAAAQAIENFYASDGDGSFSDLVELLSGGRDDNRVTDTIFKLYDFIRSHPFYEDWLAGKEKMYDLPFRRNKLCGEKRFWLTGLKR